MRFTLSALVLGFIALATPTHAATAHSTLARLSQRLAVAESTLAELTSRVGDGEATAVSTYTFNNGVWTDTNGANAITKSPIGVSNLAINPNTARASSVFERAASASQAHSSGIVPRALAANTAFTISTLVNWAGYMNGGATVATVFATDNDFFKLSVGAGGVVEAKLGATTVGNLGTVVPGEWDQYILAYSTETGSATVFHKGVAVGSAVSGAFPGSSKISLLNNGVEPRSAGFVGGVDQFIVYSGAVDADQASLLYQDFASAAGQSVVIKDGPTRWYGHMINSEVKFANTLQSAATGDITLSGTFVDAEFRANNQIWYIMYGVEGASSFDVATPTGTASWDANTGVLVFVPAVGTATVPMNTPWSYTIPGSALNLRNPNVQKLASHNDGRWAMSVYNLDLNQIGVGKTRQQGLRWQAIEKTPATQNPNGVL